MSRSRLLKNSSERLLPVWMLIFACAIIILGILHIAFGQVSLSLKQVVDALRNVPELEYHRQIVWELRVPRTLIAIAAGAMLGLAGAILQAVTRNPLAEPGLLGVTSGSVLLIVIWITFIVGQNAHPAAAPIFGLIGGLASVAAVYAINWRKRGDTVRLTLTGVLLSAVLSSCTSLILLQHTEAMGNILMWTIGSLNGRVWLHWSLIWPWAAVLIPLGLLCAGAANVLQIGDRVSAGLGMRVNRTRGVLLLVAALLTAGAVSVVGAVGFIGLIGPHIARRLCGQDARRLFPLSALVSACLLVGADVVSQTVSFELPFVSKTTQATLPVGAVTALCGGPFFLYLVRRSIKNKR